MTYLVYVDGKQPPTRQHESLVNAMQEAERIALQPDNQLRKIYILRVEKINEPVISRKWAAQE